MKEYKMRQGEYLEDRAPNLDELVEEYFGPVNGTEQHDGVEMFVVENPSNPAFERVLAGTRSHAGKKDQLAVHFEERPVTELLDAGETEAAEEAVSLKNEFLLEVTGRDAKSRRDSLKRDVEDDSPDV